MRYSFLFDLISATWHVLKVWQFELNLGSFEFCQSNMTRWRNPFCVCVFVFFFPASTASLCKPSSMPFWIILLLLYVNANVTRGLMPLVWPSANGCKKPSVKKRVGGWWRSYTGIVDTFHVPFTLTSSLHCQVPLSCCVLLQNAF